MKTARHIDPVMQELWAMKDANSARFGDLSAYVAYLRTTTATPKPSLARNQTTRTKRRSAAQV